jgi:beta-lactamase class D
LSIYDLKTGKLLPMPSDFDDFSDKAHPEYKGGTAEETRNRDLLRKLMEAESFTVNANEWWHYDYKDWQSYGLYDIAFSSINHEEKKQPKIKEDKSLKKFFDEADVKGGIVIYDLRKKQYTVFDKKRMNTAFVPASTSKIIHSLIFLDSGAVKDDTETLKWDGTKRWADAWNQDLNLRSAFKVSAAWFYHEISKRMSRETMQKYYDLSNYANRDTSGFGEIYWVKGNLRITPKEQVDFLVRLYENRLPFAPQVISNVKDMMIEEKTDTYTLRAKTGWSDAYTPQVGWWVGYLEKGNNVYFFATQIDINKNEDAAKRKEITKNILKKMKIIE